MSRLFLYSIFLPSIHLCMSWMSLKIIPSHYITSYIEIFFGYLLHLLPCISITVHFVSYSSSALCLCGQVTSVCIFVTSVCIFFTSLVLQPYFIQLLPKLRNYYFPWHEGCIFWKLWDSSLHFFYSCFTLGACGWTKLKELFCIPASKDRNQVFPLESSFA